MTELFYGLSREDIANPENIDEWDEDKLDTEEELLEFMDMVLHQHASAEDVARATIAIMEVWKSKHNPKYTDELADVYDDAWMTAGKALHAALIWDRG